MGNEWEDEPVKFEKKAVQIQDVREITYPRRLIVEYFSI